MILIINQTTLKLETLFQATIREDEFKFISQAKICQTEHKLKGQNRVAIID